MPVNGFIFDIARGSLHDGPGLRTVVYMKGCNMRCRWCHNPEGFEHTTLTLFYPEKCIACGRCVDVCPTCHTMREGMHLFDRESCHACGRCVDACPARALERCGRDLTVDELMTLLHKDLHYFRRGGGVSFSGGECLLQPAFVAETARRCREEGIHVLIESALNVPWGDIEPVAACADAFYADIKLMDSTRHRACTGVGNERILSNIRRLTEIHPAVTVRTPLIPGANDDMDNLLETLRFARKCGAIAFQLLRYNPLSANKYARVGRQYTAFGTEPQTEQQMNELCTQLNKDVNAEHYVFWKA